MYDFRYTKRSCEPNTIKRILIIVAGLGGILLIALISPELVHAQPPPPPSTPRYGEPVPIDGGLGILAAAGAAYAVRKLRKK